jgi:hypothetical protein
MGIVYRIERTLDNYAFVVSNRYTGERMQVRVDPDKIRLHMDLIEKPGPIEVCPFFYPGTEGDASCCLIHLTRPVVCREFFCCRIVITDPCGKRAGRVMGTRHLCPESLELEEMGEQDKKNQRA